MILKIVENVKMTSRHLVKNVILMFIFLMDNVLILALIQISLTRINIAMNAMILSV